MKKSAFILAVVFFFGGCDGEIKINEQKLDTAGARIRKSLEKGVDSAGAKLDRLKDKLDKDDTLSHQQY